MREVAAGSMIGMPVYSINEGESIGVIKSLIMDPEEKQLLALTIDRKGWYKDVKIVAAGKIKNIGADAVTIHEKTAAARAANLPKMIKYMHQPGNIVGNRIISDDGHTLGKIDEFYINSETGKICRLDINSGIRGNIISGKGSLRGEYIITIGEAAVVVAKEALESVEAIAGPFKANLHSTLERASKARTAAVDGSIKLGKNIAASLSEARERRRIGNEAAERALEAAEQSADHARAEAAAQAEAPDSARTAATEQTAAAGQTAAVTEQAPNPGQTPNVERSADLRASSAAAPACEQAADCESPNAGDPRAL